MKVGRQSGHRVGATTRCSCRWDPSRPRSGHVSTPVVFINEVNSIPGAMALYLFPDADPGQLLLGMVEPAKAADGSRRFSYEDGAALRTAGGIAAKLSRLGPQR